MKLLHLDSSILGSHSASRGLTAEAVAGLRAAHPEAELIYRDLAAQPVPAVDATLLAARGTPAEQRTEAQQTLVTAADAVMAEFLAADTLVIGAPMYNFSIPAQLKAWVDLIAVAGVTFRYGPNGAEGLARGKRAFIVATAGGVHAGTPTGLAHADYLRLLLNFLGVADVRVINAEGLAMGPEARDASLGRASRELAEATA